MVKMRDTITLIVACSMFIAIFTFILPAETCRASELTVGPGEYTSIQSAIDAAEDNDTILVTSGNYYENIEINKPLTISGAGSSNTHIIGNNANKNTVKIISNNVVLSGFSIDNTKGKNNHYKCILIQSAQECSISDNLIKNGEDGIYLLSANYIIIDNNVIQDSNNKAIKLSSSNDNAINKNTIQSNGDGIYVISSNSNEIFENDILSNNYGVYIQNSNSNYIYKNDFDDNQVSNAYDSSGNNQWYKTNQGNYWDDYNNYDISPKDNIGDTPYDINGEGNEQDIYPLGDFLTYNQIPEAFIDSITPSSANAGEIVYFNGHSTDDDVIIQREWSSSKDGVFGTTEDCSYSGLSVGTHTIKFRVKDSEQWSDYDTGQLVINPAGSAPNQKPTAYIQSISPQTAEYGEEVSFTGYGVDEDGTVQLYNWSSSIDGYLPSSSIFTSTSLSVGTHNIAFKVRDNEYSWSDPVYKTVTIKEVTIENDNPVAATNGPYTAYINDTITFDASESYDNDGTIIKYKWDFGDGNTKEGETATHTYTEENQYIVTLTITDNLGAQDTKTTTATIITQPDEQQNNGETKNDKWVIPGFEVITAFLVLTIIVVIKKKKQR
jgi:parallel beta-helix repeat protein